MSSIIFDPDLTNTIDLKKLELGMPGLTPRIGACFAEAAITCLEEESHTPGVSMLVDGEFKHQLKVLWINQGDTDQRKRAWRDADEATEQGACGIAALLVEVSTEYTIVERARKGPGFDYWLGKKDSDTPLFQNKARLEVSGIRRGDEASIESRVRRKTKQIEPSDSNLPGLIAVIEFGAPRARVRVI